MDTTLCSINRIEIYYGLDLSGVFFSTISYALGLSGVVFSTNKELIMTADVTPKKGQTTF